MTQCRVVLAGAGMCGKGCAKRSHRLTSEGVPPVTRLSVQNPRRACSAAATDRTAASVCFRSLMEILGCGPAG